MASVEIDSEWRHLREFLPADLDALARETGAIERPRKLRSGEDLLRLCLAYAVPDFSLRTVAGWAAKAGLGKFSNVALLYRFTHAVGFLQRILTILLSRWIRGGESAPGTPLRLVDATCISIPGSQGTDWRLHCVYDPVQARLISVEITDKHGGERLDRQHYPKGAVVVGDRGLSRAAGLHAVAADGAYSLLRAHFGNIRLCTFSGGPLPVNSVLSRADRDDMGTDVIVPLKGHAPLRARLIVRPLPEPLAERAREHMRRNAAKKGRKVGGETLKQAGYFMLLTTIPAELAPDAAVAEFYRVRWQIELYFKRIKSLGDMDRLRARDEALTQTYLLSKLIGLLLSELLTLEGEFFSPWGVPRLRRPA